MDFSVGEIIVYSIALIGFFAFLIVMVVRSDRSESNYPRTPPKFSTPPPVGMWTTYTPTGPPCTQTEKLGEDYINICILNAGHKEDHLFKGIYVGDLYPKRTRDDDV